MTDEQLVDALKAIAHPIRLRIMQALAGGEHNVGEIDEAAGIGQPTLSQQLAVLRNAGLVSTRKEAKLVYYRIEASVLQDISASVAALDGTEMIRKPASRPAAPGVANFARMA